MSESRCPNCQAEVADDFGLLDCPGCGAVLFVEMDGSVRAQGEDVAEVSEMAAPLENEYVDEQPQPEEAPTSMTTMNEEAAETYDDSEPFSDLSAQESEESSEFAEPSEQIEAPDTTAENEAVYTFDEDEVNPPVEVASSASSGSATEDLGQLANAIDQGVELSGLRYDVVVHGIDTADLRRETREALTDVKLGWNVDELMKNVNAGRLELKSISAIKAQIVIQRLKVLPVTVTWEQYADI